MSLEYDENKIQEDEPVAHFLLTRSELATSPNLRVKAKALEPSKTHNNISVIRHINMNDEEIWQWAVDWVELKDFQGLHARAEVLVSEVLSLALQIDPRVPPPRHAEIFGWPTERHAMIDLAQDLADKCKVVLNPTPANLKR